MNLPPAVPPPIRPAGPDPFAVPGAIDMGSDGDRTVSSGDPEGWFNAQVRGIRLEPHELGWHLYQSTERIPFTEALMGLPTEGEVLGGSVTPTARTINVTNSTNQCFFLTVADATVQVVYGGKLCGHLHASQQRLVVLMGDQRGIGSAIRKPKLQQCGRTRQE